MYSQWRVKSRLETLIKLTLNTLSLMNIPVVGFGAFTMFSCTFGRLQLLISRLLTLPASNGAAEAWGGFLKTPPRPGTAQPDTSSSARSVPAVSWRTSCSAYPPLVSGPCTGSPGPAPFRRYALSPDSPPPEEGGWKELRRYSGNKREVLDRRLED